MLEGLDLSAGLGMSWDPCRKEVEVVEEVSRRKEVWISLLRLLPPQPGPGW